MIYRNKRNWFFLCIFLILISFVSASLDLEYDDGLYPRVVLGLVTSHLGSFSCNDNQLLKFNTTANNWYCADGNYLRYSLSYAEENVTITFLI